MPSTKHSIDFIRDIVRAECGLSIDQNIAGHILLNYLEGTTHGSAKKSEYLDSLSHQAKHVIGLFDVWYKWQLWLYFGMVDPDFVKNFLNNFKGFLTIV